jgi:SAM-dependent methyltransferase
MDRIGEAMVSQSDVFTSNELQKYFQLEGNFDLAKATNNLLFHTVLDVGFGNGAASRYFAMQGKGVVAIDRDIKHRNAPLSEMKKLEIEIVESSFENFKTDSKFDAIWMSHILEHTLNVGQFLDNARSLLKDDGWLFVMVPPFKHAVVGGHVTPGWNIGILMYALLMSRFDIKNGHFIRHGYNICGFVQKLKCELPALRLDEGDIETTRDFWPMEVHQGFDGNLESVNWFNSSQD